MSDVDKQETFDRLQDMGYTICDGTNGLRHVVLPDGNEYYVRIWPKDYCVTAQVTDAKFTNNPVVAWGTSGDTLDDVIKRVMKYICP